MNSGVLILIMCIVIIIIVTTIIIIIKKKNEEIPLKKTGDETIDPNKEVNKQSSKSSTTTSTTNTTGTTTSSKSNSLTPTSTTPTSSIQNSLTQSSTPTSSTQSSTSNTTLIEPELQTNDVTDNYVSKFSKDDVSIEMVYPNCSKYVYISSDDKLIASTTGSSSFSIRKLKQIDNKNKNEYYILKSGDKYLTSTQDNDGNITLTKSDKPDIANDNQKFIIERVAVNKSTSDPYLFNLRVKTLDPNVSRYINVSQDGLICTQTKPDFYFRFTTINDSKLNCLQLIDFTMDPVYKFNPEDDLPLINWFNVYLKDKNGYLTNSAATNGSDKQLFYIITDPINKCINISCLNPNGQVKYLTYSNSKFSFKILQYNLSTNNEQFKLQYLKNDTSAFYLTNKENIKLNLFQDNTFNIILCDNTVLSKQRFESVCSEYKSVDTFIFNGKIKQRFSIINEQTVSHILYVEMYDYSGKLYYKYTKQIPPEIYKDVKIAADDFRYDNRGYCLDSQQYTDEQGNTVDYYVYRSVNDSSLSALKKQFAKFVISKTVEKSKGLTELFKIRK